jgi:hypothetical protein
MHTEQIDVLSYAGRRGDERPLTFILRGLRIYVIAILDHWIEEGFEDRARKRHFTVKGSDGNSHQIYYDEQVLEWFYTS